MSSDYTYQAGPGLFQLTHRGPLRVKGRAAEVVAYSVEGVASSGRAEPVARAA